MERLKILLVDDEVSVLKALSRELMMLDVDVEVFSSPLEALKYLETDRSDIIISDFLMPEMDGITFLSIVKDKYPSNLRILLSGQVDINKALVALYSGIANDYIPKPWDKKNITDKIDLYSNIQKSLNNSEIIKYIENMGNLPSLPSTLYDVQMAVQKEIPINKIAGIIEKDPVMTAKLIHVANSAFYGLKNVKGVKQVLNFIGLNTVLDIILITSIMDGAKDSYVINEINQIARRSFLINKAISVYSMIKKITDKDILSSSIGVVHDIGKIILVINDRDGYVKIKDTMKSNPGITFYQAEILLGRSAITHQEIGAYFLKLWNFSAKCVEITLFHNNPDKTGENNEMLKVLYNCCRIVDNFINVGEYDAVNIDFLTKDEYKKIKMYLMDE